MGIWLQNTQEQAEVAPMGVLATEENESLQVTWDMSGAVLVGCRMAQGPQFVFPVLQGGRDGGMEGGQCPGGTAFPTACQDVYLA